MVHKFGAKRTTPVVWTVQILALSFHITGHHAPSRASYHPKTSQGDFLYDTKLSWGLKSIFGEGWFSTFLAPLCWLREMGQNGVSGQVLLRFAPFLLQWFFYRNVDDSYKNDTDQVSGWWDMREWWWKIGFTPWAIRHVCRNWQFSSSSVAKIPLGTKFGNCQLGRTYSIPIQKYPCLGPQLTPSGKFLHKHVGNGYIC